MKAAQHPKPVTAYAFVGNLGCIRFPQPIRKASGIKRGDRLAVQVQDAQSIVLERVDIPDWIPADAIEVAGCACSQAPEGCRKGRPEFVTVGWSYIKLEDETAKRLGFLPESPVKLVGETSRITVSLHQNLRDLRGVAKVACPP